MLTAERGPTDIVDHLEDMQLSFHAVRQVRETGTYVPAPLVCSLNALQLSVGGNARQKEEARVRKRREIAREASAVEQSLLSRQRTTINSTNKTLKQMASSAGSNNLDRESTTAGGKNGDRWQGTCACIIR